MTKQEVAADTVLWRGDVHFCNGGHCLVCFVMLKYMKIAAKRVWFEIKLALERR